MVLQRLCYARRSSPFTIERILFDMSNITLRRRKDKAVFWTNISLVGITILPLFLIIGTILINGIGQINWAFFTEKAPTSVDAMMAKLTADQVGGGHIVLPGGIANGILGTLIMVVLASVLAVPPGILGGIYLSEMRNTKLASVVRFLTDLLQGTPSIVLGIVVYIVVVIPMKSYSALAGAVVLAVMMLPLVIRSTEETLLRLPKSMKESSLALGCSYRAAVLKVLLPSARSGLLTGILLAISRIIGETAPLIMTALGSRMINWDILKPTGAVPLLIWEFYNDPNLLEMIWSSSLFLLLLVLTLNIIAKRIAAKTAIK